MDTSFDNSYPAPVSHGPSKYRLISLEKKVETQKLLAKDQIDFVSKKMDTMKSLN
jgi:hypothetical protein